MKDLLYKFLYEGTNTTSPETVMISMGVAFVLSLIVYFVYKVTFNGVIYSKKFNISLVMLTMITSMVMNIIGSSVALSLGMVGALSIVRFRTAIKDPRDTAYIFWAICIGLGVGTSNYYIVCIGTVVIAFIAIILSLGIKNDESFLVIIRATGEASEEVRERLFKIYKSCKLRSETVADDYVEIVYQVKIKDNQDVKKYEKIREITGVSLVNLVSQNGEVLG